MYGWFRRVLHTYLCAPVLIEATVKVRESQTVTETKSYWLPASLTGVKYGKIEEIDFTSAKMKKKALDMKFSDTPASKRGSKIDKIVQQPTESEINQFLCNLNSTGAMSAILSVKESFQMAFIPKAVNPQFPRVMTDLFKTDMLSASYSEIIAFCQTLEVTVSKEESDCVEQVTKQQSETKLWNRFRSGRITASRMHSVCHSSPAKPSESLIKAICYPESAKFTSVATTWGCTHEKDGLDIYKDSLGMLHDNFIVEEAGFTINPQYPVLGASPDARVSCDRCGMGVVEVKCPHCVRSSTLDMYTGSKSCLEETEDGRQLKKTHPYYYQIQTQIFICGSDYADFVVWTEKEVHIERIEPDADFWNNVAKKALNFHTMAIMPELVGRFYSRHNTPAPLGRLSFINTQVPLTPKNDVPASAPGETNVFLYLQTRRD